MKMSEIEIPNLSDSQKLYKTLVEGLISHDTRLTNIREDVNYLEKKQEHIDEILITGNGEIALREQVRRNTEFINTLKYWSRFIGGILVAWVVAQVIVVIVAANWITTSLMPLLQKIAVTP